MPISRITKIGGTQGTKLASGTTAQRGSVEGEWRYNSETGFFEGRNDTKFLTSWEFYNRGAGKSIGGGKNFPPPPHHPPI